MKKYYDDAGTEIDFGRGIEIVSGEGTGEGTVEEYTGVSDYAHLLGALETERALGDRWAFARPKGSTMSEERYAI